MSGTDTLTRQEEAALRAALRTGRDRLVPGRAPWPDLERRRTAGRRRRAGVVALLAVGVLAAGLVAGPGRGAPDAGPAGPGPRQSSEPVGTLAGNPAFLAGLRERVASLRGLTSPDDVRVLVATDVDGGRLALVDWPGLGGYEWYAGPGGRTPPAQLRRGGTCDAGSPCVLWTASGWYVGDASPDTWPVAAPTGLVVVATPDARVSVTNGNDVALDGTVRPLTVRVKERWPGVFVGRLAELGGRVDVTVTPRRGPSGTWTAVTSTVPYPDADRGEILRQVQLLTGVATAYQQDVRFLVLQTVGGRTDAVVVVRAPSGGWARAVLVRWRPDASFSVYGVESLSAGVDPQDVPVAWQEGGRAYVVGVPGATTVRLVTRAGDVDRVPLTGAVTEVPIRGRAFWAQLFDVADGERGVTEVAVARLSDQVLAGPAPGAR